jgi:hypothetical protein
MENATGVTKSGDRGWLRDATLLVAALAVAWWAHGDRPVQAASGDLQFQMEAAGDTLLLYSAGDRSIYVYKGASSGNSNMQCSYKFVVTAPGRAQRESCDMTSLTR